jgi:GNAT superfamily N-acetyltransferase
MSLKYRIERDGCVEPGEIEDLRSAVKWDKFGKYDHSLNNSYTHFTTRVDGQLVAFINVVSDGIGAAFLLDLIVHPDYQRQGVGKAIVRATIDQLTLDGIQCIQATFSPELEDFYRKCGFHIIKAGIIDNKHRSETL